MTAYYEIAADSNMHAQPILWNSHTEPIIENRTIKISIWVTEAERDELKRLASEAKTNVSRYVRTKVLAK